MRLPLKRKSAHLFIFIWFIGLRDVLPLPRSRDRRTAGASVRNARIPS